MPFYAKDDPAVDGSSYDAAFTTVDTNGDPIAPTELHWTLYGPGGVIINNRLQVALPLQADQLISLDADDLRYAEGSQRTIVVKGRYTGANGTRDIATSLTFDILALRSNQ
jgi:hypothetical protein